ncbi:MAG: hypothetical protein QOH43_1822 [Solirubrobacteraceae bacterium]|jgi:hypothetical protein|nr:hypothetical protein [Solirubrobacteraceae bacterium]
MSQVLKLRRKATRIAGVGASLGALALGGSALADAATNKTSTTGTSTTPQGTHGSAPQGAQQGRPQRDPTTPGGHVGANGKTEAALPADVAAKVKAAAEAKVSGGTVERVETDVDHGSPYEAHVRKADGTEVEVLVNSSFDVTAVNTMQHR